MAQQQVEDRLILFRRRYRLAKLIGTAARWVAPACVPVALAVIAYRAGWFSLHPGWAAVSMTLLLALGSLAVAWRRTPALGDVALRIDEKLSTREVLAAAVEVGAASDHPLAREARRRAGAVLEGAVPAQLVPLVSGRPWNGLLAGLLLLAMAPLVPLPFARTVAQTPAPPEVAAAGEALEERLEELSDEMIPESAEARETMEQLEALAEQMQSSEIGSREEALAALDGIEEALRQDELAASGKEARERARQAVAELAEDPFTEGLASALDAEDEAAIRSALEKMAKAMPRDRAEANARLDEMRRLAERLESLAEALEEAGRGEDAEKLREVAEAIRNFDLERATELMQSMEVAEALEALGEDGELQGELAEAVNMARYLLNLDRMPELGEGVEGLGEGQSGPMPGNTSTNLEEDSYVTGDPVLRQRQNEEESARTGSFQQLYDSHIIEAESWVDVQAPGKLGDTGAYTEQRGRGMGADEGVQTPQHFFDAAAAGGRERAAELERVPLGYRDLVQRYFDRGDSTPPDTEGKDE